MTMKQNRKILTVILTLFCAVQALSAASPFNSKLTKDEQKTLDSGKVLIKKIDYASNMSLQKGFSDQNDKLLANIKNFSPKYLVEIIQVKPVKGNEDLPQKLEDVLLNVSDYAGIPYYSERNEKWYDLYSRAWIDSQQEKNGVKTLKAHFDMEPFGVIDEDITCSKDGNYLFYEAINTSNVKYKGGIECFGKGKLKIVVSLFKNGDEWVLYGIGGVNALRFPFLTDRIDTSFVNRIKSFCNYVFDKL